MKKYAVIGNPIGHSLSPVMHNAAFKEMGVDAVYEKIEVKDLAKEYEKLKDDYSGINVTIPYKLAIMELLDSKDMAAELIGAVNCVDFKDEATSIGYNTDITGAIDALKSKENALKGKCVLVLGAGGAARAVVFGCALEGMEISLWNRTKDKAEALSKDLKEKLGAGATVQKEQSLDGIDILVNTTSVGMTPKILESPLTCKIPKDIIVMDIVYNPLETKLLRDAKTAGAMCINGLEMLVLQGAESQRIWGYDPPVEVMRKAALNELS